MRERIGEPLILVHAAGITGVGGIEDEAPATWRRILDVNLTSAYLCGREVVGGMRRAGWGRIVLVASVNGRFGGSALSGPAYAASKGGLLTLARFLAREHAADGITANAVAPGPHDTPMWTALDAERRHRILSMQPGGDRGPGRPERPRGDHRPPVQRRSPLHHRRHDRRQRRPVDGVTGHTPGSCVRVAKGVGDLTGQGGELGLVAEVLRARVRERHGELGHDPAGPGRHHRDSGREVHRLADGVGDEQRGEALVLEQRGAARR